MLWICQIQFDHLRAFDRLLGCLDTAVECFCQVGPWVFGLLAELTNPRATVNGASQHTLTPSCFTQLVQ